MLKLTDINMLFGMNRNILNMFTSIIQVYHLIKQYAYKIHIYIYIHIYICTHHVSYTTQVKSFGSGIFFGCCQVPQTWLSFRLVVVVVIGHVPRSGAQYRGPRCCGLVPFRPLSGSHFPVGLQPFDSKGLKSSTPLGKGMFLSKVRQAVLKLLLGIILGVV